MRSFAPIAGINQTHARATTTTTYHNVLGHSQARVADKADAHVVVDQEVCQAVAGAAVLEITQHGDGQTVDRAKLLADRVQVQKGLFCFILFEEKKDRTGVSVKRSIT